MRCPKCNTDCPDRAKLCIECGYSFIAARQASERAAAVKAVAAPTKESVPPSPAIPAAKLPPTETSSNAPMSRHAGTAEVLVERKPTVVAAKTASTKKTTGRPVATKEKAEPVQKQAAGEKPRPPVTSQAQPTPPPEPKLEPIEPPKGPRLSERIGELSKTLQAAPALAGDKDLAWIVSLESLFGRIKQELQVRKRRWMR
jgi:hypothetical protein